MSLLAIVFLGFLGLTSGVHFELMDFEHVWTLRPGKTVLPVKSAMYPNPAPGNMISTWEIKTDPSATIKLTCYDVYIPPLHDGECDEGLYIFTVRDGEYLKKYCGRHTVHYVSNTNRLYLFHRTSQNDGGAVNCTVRAFNRPATPPPPIRESDEPDSSEHGGPPGVRSTNCTCGWANKGKLRVIGGKETDVNEYPFNVGLRRIGWISPFCGGSIITPFHVLTSAHCVINYKPEEVEVMIGEHNYRKGGESDVTYTLPVSVMELHDDYVRTKGPRVDIAVLVLNEEIKFNKFIGPVCLPSKPLDLEGRFVKVIGWGRTQSYGQGSEYVKEVNVRVVPIQKCHSCFGFHVDLTDPRLVCTYSKMKGIGLGDSGGPVVWLNPDTNRYTLVGLPALVALYDKDLHRCPDMSADVSTYLDWIHDKIEKTNPRGMTCAAED